MSWLIKEADKYSFIIVIVIEKMIFNVKNKLLNILKRSITTKWCS